MVGELVTGEVYQVWKREVLLLDDEKNELLLPKDQQIPTDVWHNIFSVKMRDFEDHTLDETWILTALVLNACVAQGVFLYSAVAWSGDALFSRLNANVFLYCGILSVLCLVFYLCQLVLYRMLGYVFGTAEQTQSVLNGFKAMVSLQGLLLLPEVMLMLTFPHCLLRPRLCAEQR